jgi:uncharacterized membrane protein YbhN (UPF0104 family)
MSDPAYTLGSPPPPSRGAPPRGFCWVFLAKLGLTALVLALLAARINLQQLGAVLANGQAGLLLAAVTPTVVLNLVKPVRWLWLLRAVLPDCNYGVAFRSALVGAGARLLLPSKVGEFGRVLDVPRLPLLTGAGLVVLDLLMEMIAACLLAVPGLLIYAGPAVAGLAVLLSTTCIVALFFPRRFLWLVSRVLHGGPRLSSRLEAARDVVRLVGRRTLLRGVAISVVLNLLRFGQLVLLLLSVGAPMTARAVVVLPVVQLADGFPFTVGGLGVREWLGAYLLPAYGIRAEAAVAAIFLQYVISNVLPGIPGWWLLLRARGQAAAGVRREGPAACRVGGRSG